MNGDPEHPADDKTKTENPDAKKAQIKGVQTKSQVRKVIFWEAIAAQVLALVGIVSLIGHKFIILGCGISLVYFALVSLITYRRLIHNLGRQKEARKQSVIILSCGIAPMVLICLFAWRDSFPPALPPQPAFAVTSRVSFINPSLDINRQPFWFVHENEKSAINLMTYIRLINLRDVPLEIDSYSVEIKTGTNWLPFHSIDVRSGMVFYRMQADFNNSIGLNCYNR